MSHSVKQPTLFEVFDRSETSVVSQINAEALQSLVDILLSGDGQQGRVILLRSPRAGYGKTLLLHSTKVQSGDAVSFFAVESCGGGRIDGEATLESVLRQLASVLPGSGGLTEFDFVTRRLLAVGLKPLLISGEIPSHDREGALYAIENRPIETFDFHHQQAATAHWTQANFEVLGPRLASELSEVSHCGLRDCAYWIDLLFRYATSPPEKVERSRLLSEAVFRDIKELGANAAEDRLQSLLCLLNIMRPTVLVFDETEGLSNQPEAGLRLSSFIVQLRQACPKLSVILSVNEDVWSTGLTPLMPGGLRDRLTEYEVKLSELTRDEASLLLQSCFGKNAGLIKSRLTWPDPLYARALIKEGVKVANELSRSDLLDDTSATSLVAGATVPPPLTDSNKEEISAEDSPAAETQETKQEDALEEGAKADVDSAPEGSPFEIAMEPAKVPEKSAVSVAGEISSEAQDFAAKSSVAAASLADPFSLPSKAASFESNDPVAPNSIFDEPPLSGAEDAAVENKSPFSSSASSASQPVDSSPNKEEKSSLDASSELEKDSAADFATPSSQGADSDAVAEAREWLARQVPSTEPVSMQAPQDEESPFSESTNATSPFSSNDTEQTTVQVEDASIPAKG